VAATIQWINIAKAELYKASIHSTCSISIKNWLLLDLVNTIIAPPSLNSWSVVLLISLQVGQYVYGVHITDGF